MDHPFLRDLPVQTEDHQSWNTEFSIPYQIRIIARKQTGLSLQQLGRHPPCRRVIRGLMCATVLGSQFGLFCYFKAGKTKLTFSFHLL